MHRKHLKQHKDDSAPSPVLYVLIVILSALPPAPRPGKLLLSFFSSLLTYFYTQGYYLETGKIYVLGPYDRLDSKNISLKFLAPWCHLSSLSSSVEP